MNISFFSIGFFDIAFFVASLCTLLAINLLRPIAISINLIDSPSSRKKHHGSIPLIGGISMFFGLFVGMLISDVDLSINKYFLLASFIVVVIGALDDKHEISVYYRLFFQISVAIIVSVIADINIETVGSINPFREEIVLNSWERIITILAIIVAINALNMTDGIHGLAGSSSLVSFISLAFFSYINGNLEGLIISTLMCAVILPFLFYNLFSKSQIFMGDAGSMFLGLGIVWLLVYLSQGTNNSFAPVIALWIFALPLLDAVSTVFIRILKRKSPFKPDLSHLHHILMLVGLSRNIVLIVIVIFSILTSLIGIFAELNQVDEWKMFFAFILVFIFLFLFKFSIISKNTNFGH